MKKLIFPGIIVLILFGYFVGKPLYMQPSYQRGELAPEITGTTLNNESFSLSDLKGKYVLIDFWGSKIAKDWKSSVLGLKPMQVAGKKQFSKTD